MVDEAPYDAQGCVRYEERNGESVDNKSVTKLVAAILAGHAASTTGKNSSPATYVEKYLEVLKELEANDSKENADRAKAMAKSIGGASF